MTCPRCASVTVVCSQVVEELDRRRRRDLVQVREWLAHYADSEDGPSFHVPDEGAAEPLLLDTDAVAAALSVSRTTVKRLIREGLLPAVKVVGATRVRREDLRQYVENLLRVGGHDYDDAAAPVP